VAGFFLRDFAGAGAFFANFHATTFAAAH